MSPILLHTKCTYKISYKCLIKSFMNEFTFTKLLQISGWDFSEPQCSNPVGEIPKNPISPGLGFFEQKPTVKPPPQGFLGIFLGLGSQTFFTKSHEIYYPRDNPNLGFFRVMRFPTKNPQLICNLVSGLVQLALIFELFYDFNFN